MKRKISLKRITITHHKCASQFNKKIVQEVCKYLSIPHITVGWSNFNRKLRREHLDPNVFLIIDDYSSKMNLDFSSDFLAYHIIRDPRDLFVSMYFSHRDCHPLNRHK